MPPVSQRANSEAEPDLASDLIEGGKGIAIFIYGDERRARTVYRLADQGKLPTFSMNGRLCARKSTLRAYIAAQERAALSARTVANGR